MRPMIDYYGILSIPLAASLVWISKLKLKIFPITAVVLLTSLGVVHSIQYHYSVIHFDSMTRATYKMIFLKFHQPPGYWETLRVPDYTKAAKGIYVYKGVHDK